MAGSVANAANDQGAIRRCRVICTRTNTRVRIFHICLHKELASRKEASHALRIPKGSWVSCNFHFCLVATSFLLGCNLFLSPSHATQLYRHVLLLTEEHELDLQSRPLSTTIQEPAGISCVFYLLPSV